MDDILVIILTLVIAVFGALNQRKKKKTQKPVSESVSKPESQDFWDMIMDQVDEKEPEPQPVIQEEYIEPEPVEKPRVEAIPKNNFSDLPEGVYSIKEEMQLVEKTKRRKLVLGEEFSLKKAVIYNEILNRKYT